VIATRKAPKTFAPENALHINMLLGVTEHEPTEVE